VAQVLLVRQVIKKSFLKLTDLSREFFRQNFSLRGRVGDDHPLEAGQDGQVEAVRGRRGHFADVLDGEAQHRVLPFLQVGAGC